MRCSHAVLPAGNLMGPFVLFAMTADQHGDYVEDSWTGLLVVPGRPGAPAGQRLVRDSQKAERAVERDEPSALLRCWTVCRTHRMRPRMSRLPGEPTCCVGTGRTGACSSAGLVLREADEPAERALQRHFQASTERLFDVDGRMSSGVQPAAPGREASHVVQEEVGGPPMTWTCGGCPGRFRRRIHGSKLVFGLSRVICDSPRTGIRCS